MSEQFIRDRIASYYPKHQILAEESGITAADSDYRWIVDPLDGTTNYAHGYPVFCVSIALEYQKEIILGVIYDPTRDEIIFNASVKSALKIYLAGIFQKIFSNIVKLFMKPAEER